MEGFFKGILPLKEKEEPEFYVTGQHFAHRRWLQTFKLAIPFNSSVETVETKGGISLVVSLKNGESKTFKMRRKRKEKDILKVI